MAISFDLASNFFDNAGLATTFTNSHTCTGSNLALVVNIYIDPTGGRSVTGVTYNSVAMTLVTSRAGIIATQYQYILLAPSTGANNIVVSTSAALLGNKQIGFTGQSYTGSKQTGQPDSFGANDTTLDTSTNFAVATTVVASNCWLVGAAQSDLNGTIGGGSAGAGTTYRGSIAGNLWGADSNGTVSTGSQTLNYGKSSTADDCTGITLSLAPATATVNSGFFWAAAR